VRDLLQKADETPVTLLVAIAYVTLAVLTDPFQPTIAQLADYGALRATDVWDGEPWRLLTYAFLHGGIVHLAVNMMSLLQLGPLLERSIGSLRFAALYIVTAIGGGIFGCYVNHPLSPMVGGSGALFGMMGALLALLARSGRHSGDFFGSGAVRSLAGNIVVNLVLGWLIPYVSNAGHIGGLITGFAVTLCFLTNNRREPSRIFRALQATCVALFAAGVFSVVAPVTRWDYLLLHWQRAAPGPQRDQLRTAYWTAMSDGEVDELVQTQVPDDEATDQHAAKFAAMRRHER
jgi:rhomboid protease GluP